MEKENNDLWGPIEKEHWDKILFIKGRIATIDDVKSGCAVFYIENAEPHFPLDILLPSLANQVEEETGSKKQAVVVQAENVAKDKIIGLRYFEGGNAVCHLHEIEFV
jgi:hypothetical protein